MEGTYSGLGFLAGDTPEILENPKSQSEFLGSLSESLIPGAVKSPLIFFDGHYFNL